MVQLATALTAEELAEDPHDIVANLIVHTSTRLDEPVLVHGVVKLAIVTAFLLGSRRIYPWAIGALIALLIAQVLDLAVKFSPLVLGFGILDAAIILITVREWRHGRTLHDVIRKRVPRLSRIN